MSGNIGTHRSFKRNQSHSPIPLDPDLSGLRPFVFLQLPPELRNQIYNDIFRFDPDLPLGLNHKFDHARLSLSVDHTQKVHTGLLRTCRQIKEEAHSVFRTNHFTYEVSYWNIVRRFRTTGPRLARAPASFYEHIQNLTIYMSALYPLRFYRPGDLPDKSYRNKYNKKVERSIRWLVKSLKYSPPVKLHIAIRVAAHSGDDDESWKEGHDYKRTLSHFEPLNGRIDDPRITFTGCYCGSHRANPAAITYARKLERRLRTKSIYRAHSVVSDGGKGPRRRLPGSLRR